MFLRIFIFTVVYILGYAILYLIHMSNIGKLSDQLRLWSMLIYIAYFLVFVFLSLFARKLRNENKVKYDDFKYYIFIVASIFVFIFISIIILALLSNAGIIYS